MAGVWRELLQGHITLQSLNVEFFDPKASVDDRVPITIRSALRKRELTDAELNDPEHPLIRELMDAHESGDPSKKFSRTGKLILYPIPAYILDGQLVSRFSVIDIDLDKNTHDFWTPDQGLHPDRLERVQRIDEAISKLGGVRPFYAFSRLFGLHIWNFYKKPTPLPLVFNDIRWLRDYLYRAGCFKELDENYRKIGDQTTTKNTSKIDLRPAVPLDTRAKVYDAVRCIALPYHSCYDRRFYLSDMSTEIDSVDFWTLDIDKIRSSGKRKSFGDDEYQPEDRGPGRPRREGRSAPTAEDLEDIVRRIARSNIHEPQSEWQTLSSGKHNENLLGIPENLDGDIVEQLSPCLINRIVNGPKVTDGWNEHIKYEVALQVIPAHKADADIAEVTASQTQIMNHLDGEDSPQPADYYMKEILSAKKALEKGTHISCHRKMGGREWMVQSCCPGQCSMYRKVQEQGSETAPEMIFNVENIDPLAIKSDKTSLVLPYGFLVDPDSVDINDPQTYVDKLLAFSISSRGKSGLLWALTHSEMAHVDLYDMSALQSIEVKIFDGIYNRLVSKRRLKVVLRSQRPAHYWRKLINETTPHEANPHRETELSIMAGVEDGVEYIYLSDAILQNGMFMAMQDVRVRTSYSVSSAVEFYMKELFQAKLVDNPNWTMKRWKITWQQCIDVLSPAVETQKVIGKMFKRDVPGEGKPPSNVTAFASHKVRR